MHKDQATCLSVWCVMQHTVGSCVALKWACKVSELVDGITIPSKTNIFLNYYYYILMCYELTKDIKGLSLHTANRMFVAFFLAGVFPISQEKECCLGSEGLLY